MAYRILSPTNSFIQMGESSVVQSCNFADIDLCLPVYEEDDVWFQFIVQADSEAEADVLCDLENALVTVSINDGCNGTVLKTFTQKPDRYRVSSTQVLYNWQHGLPEFAEVVSVGSCFVIKIVIDEETESCSNCLQRIASDCHTSVIEYGNDDNFAGFNYCNSGSVGGEESDCDPTFISFTNQSMLTIPYTAGLLAKYGEIPTLKVWIYDTDGKLTNMSVQQKFDGFPATEIIIDLGGPATGVLKIS